MGHAGNAALISKWLTGAITPELKSMLILDEALEELVEGR